MLPPVNSFFVFVSAHGKHTRKVKAKPDIAVRPAIGSARHQRLFVHAHRVGKMQLKNMPAGFNIEPYSKRILVNVFIDNETFIIKTRAI